MCIKTQGADNADPVEAVSAEEKNLRAEMDQMKEKFAKLLLGEDMSGGGKGVSSALALSNAITNLAASVFGEQSKLEPMGSDRKARWKREIGWLFSVTDHIVEFVPSQQIAKDGTTMEVMTTQQRRDLLMNIPALRKLDTMLVDTLDNFQDQHEFWYEKKNASDQERAVQSNEKWWLPTVKVPPNGLSEESRQFLQKQKESVNQVQKASMAINAQILADMDIPESYLETLPKNGKSSLGESIYKYITDDVFDPQQFLVTMDLQSDHKVLDLKNRIEASVVIWKRKLHCKDSKSSWGLALSSEKREQFEERAETILLLLKHQFPGLAQSTLEISKIQYNRDVGLSILESYSRVLETLGNTVLSRIEDVLTADAKVRDSSQALPSPQPVSESLPSPIVSTHPSPDEEAEKLSSAAETPTSMTLSDFMGWNMEPPEAEAATTNPTANAEPINNAKEEEEVAAATPTPTPAPAAAASKSTSNFKRYLYIDKIDLSGLKSPIARH